MAGDVNNASLWADADVYVADKGTALPATATDAFGAGWELVGLLDGDDGFTEAREEDEQDHFAWGGIIVRTSRRNFKLTRTFTALEDPAVNATVRRLVYPGSSAGEIVVPRPEQVLMAFETREGSTTRRLITAEHAECSVDGDITESEAELSKYPIVATIYPDASVSPARLFVVQSADDSS